MQNFCWKGFPPVNYECPRLPTSCKNLKSVLQNEDIAWDKVMEEVQLGRIASPFSYRSISNLRCSPVGLIPKKTGGFCLITHLSYPVGDSVNDFIDHALASVHYSSFDHAVNIINQSRTNGPINAHLTIAQVMPKYNHNNEKQEALL